MISTLLFKIIIGLGLLTVGAERFIVGAASLGKRFSVSPIVIGMLLVGFGTSLPEGFVAWLAAAKGHAQIGMGSAIGSNIANIGLVLGISALLVPLRMHSKLLKREFPWLVMLGFLILFMLRDGVLSRIDGVILLILFALNIFWICYWIPKHESNDIMQSEFQDTPIQKISLFKITVFIAFGLVAMLYGADLTVISASAMAVHFSVSPLVIGLTVVAIGTSLPELAATLISLSKGEHDIAIGNVVGSNIFNLLGVLAGPALLAPGPVAVKLYERDVPFMLALILVMWLLAFLPPKRGTLSRFAGFVFLSSYLAYMYYLA
jgi:cation:H+ antiporter